MAQEVIGVGAAPNDGTGDPLRTAYQKCNDNFTELYGDRAVAMTAGEAIAAAAFVNIYASSGAQIRNANATDNTKPVNGFCPAAIASAASGAMIAPGRLISGLAGLTPGSVYYLDVIAGGITAVAPTAAGNLVQEVGVAVSATELLFHPKQGITL